MARKAITARQKVDALLWRIFLQFGSYLKDPSGEDMKPGDPVVFDHAFPVWLDGANDWENLRPVLHATNAEKAKQESKDFWKTKRIRGETKGRESRPIKSQGFPKVKRGFNQRGPSNVRDINEDVT